MLHFNELFDRNFITDRVGKISVIYASTSKPIKEQLINMGVLDEMKKEDYKWLQLLQNICLLENSPIIASSQYGPSTLESAKTAPNL